MGAGDVKLLGMAGAWLGTAGVVQAALLAMLAGGVLALAVALRNRSLGRAVANVRTMASTVSLPGGGGAGFAAPANTAGRLPYGVAIAAGTLAHLALAHAGVRLM